MGKLEPLCTAGRTVKWYGESSKHLTELPDDPAMSLLGIEAEEVRQGLDRYVHTHVHSSVIPNSQRGKQPKCPLTEGRKTTTWRMHTMGYCSALNRKDIWTHDTRWMNLKDIILSEISQSQKDKYYI